MFCGSKHDVCTPVHHNQYSLHILLPSCLHREGFFYGSTHLPLTSRLSPSHSYLQLEPLPQKTQSTSLYSSLDHLVLTFSWSPSSTSQFIPFSVSTPPPLTLATIIPVPHLLDKNPSNCSQQHHGDCFHFILFVFHLYFWYHTFLATTLTLTFLKHTYIRDYVAFDKTT